MKNLILITALLIALHGTVQAAEMSYENMKNAAEQLEQSLPKATLSKLNLSYAQPLSEAFRYCAQFNRPQPFEIISEVDAMGKIVQTWTQDSSTFAHCMAEQFKGKSIYPVQKQTFYSFFTLTFQ